MSGDYSRWSHEPWRNYGAVLLQQGRVLTDADWNEGSAIVARRLQLGGLDAFGRAAVPTETPDAFRIALSAAGELTIGLGRAYVDGLPAENHGDPRPLWQPVPAETSGTAPVGYGAQPYFPNPPARPAGGPHLVYLKVWPREVTAVEHPGLVEPALGVDTTTRSQLAWQVRLLPVAGPVTCSTPLDAIPEFAAAEPRAAGRLSSSTVQVPGQPDPCTVEPGGGYSGIENQLYRVEIHRPGRASGSDRATFTWSRDNATVAARVTEVPATLDRIVVDTLGPDDVLSFHDGEWIEITDDEHELSGTAGEMRRIVPGGGVDDATRTILLASPLPAGAFPVDGVGRADPARNTRVRRWDQRGKIYDAGGVEIGDLDDPASDGTIRVPSGSGQVLLESGIVVSFDLDPAGGIFRTGDHWLLAARTADASVSELVDAPPIGVHAHYAPLALVTFPDNALPGSVTDCRTLFPALSGLDSLSYLGGDGQEATPDTVAPGLIPLPVDPSVGVARGPIPVGGRSVRFTIDAGSGTLNGGSSPILVPTGADGTAAVGWALDPTTPLQRLRAELLRPDGVPTSLPVRFSARLRTADVVAYTPGPCADLAGVGTVQEALDRLCARSDHGGCCATVGREGEFPDIPTAVTELAARHDGHVCICLLPEDHVYDGDEIGGFTTLTIHGRGARILLGRVLALTKLSDVLIREVSMIDARRGLDSLVAAHGCERFGLDGVRLTAQSTTDDAVLVRVSGCPQVRITASELTTRARDGNPQLRMGARLPVLAQELLGFAARQPTADEARVFVANLRARPTVEREGAATAIDELVAELRPDLGARDVAVLERLGSYLHEVPELPPAELRGLFDRFGRFGLRLRDATTDAGVAVGLQDGTGDIWLESNLIHGGVAMYGSVDSDFVTRFDRAFPAILRQAEQPIPVRIGSGQLHVADNTLGWIAAGSEFEAVELFGRIVVTGNVFTARPTILAADAVLVTGNTFTAEPAEPVGLALGNAATVTGNIGPGPESILVISATDRAAAGNARLEVRP